MFLIIFSIFAFLVFAANLIAGFVYAMKKDKEHTRLHLIVAGIVLMTMIFNILVYKA